MTRKLLEPFIVRPDPDAPHDHWQEGSPLHEGAECKRCGKPFQLFWNLNCSDPRFRAKSGRKIFRDISRLPLYWCVPCFNSIDYSIVDEQTIKLMRVEGKPADQVKRKRPDPNFPYKGFSCVFGRQRLRLSTVSELPRTVRKLLSEKPPKLTELRRELLEKHVGRSVHPRSFGLMGTWVQLFGGKPNLPQGDDWIVCPNGQCGLHGKPMKVIAAIHNDPPGGLPIIESMATVLQSKTGHFNSFVVIYFHLCNACNMVHGHSQGT